ncbi:MAG: hypothetical protein K2W85_14460 [Phycisphaerales bacterium]|nr:hypothetical protein [Phycisphaerales bacterium]
MSMGSTATPPGERTSARRMLLLSVRPEFAEPLISGEKRFELRRVRPAIGPGDVVWLYSTQPRCALIGGVAVAAVHRQRVSTLWRRVRGKCGVSQADFKGYFAGLDEGYAIEVCAPTPLHEPLTLEELRRRVPGFSPPQSYWYLNDARERDARLVRLLRPAARTLARA